MDRGGLPDAHIFELVLLVIGHHPDIFLRHQRHQWLATLHCLTHLNRLAGDYPIHRRAQSAIFQIKSGLLHGGLFVLRFRLRSSRLRAHHAHLLGRGLRRSQLRAGLGNMALRGGDGRLGGIHAGAGTLLAGSGGIILLMGNLVFLD